ncbi:MAG: hypothetical protein GEV03_18890 [Streptosporangiales bacterium]|nr:hypothetical protein [Streptosporangiales bacterium]
MNEWRRGGPVSRRQLFAAGGLSAMGVALAGCTGSGDDSGGDAPAPGAGAGTLKEMGPPETTSITFAIGNPNYASQAPFFIGMENGYYEERGFTDVEVRNLEETIQAVLSRGATFGIADTDEAALAVKDGAAIRAIGCGRDRETVLMALAPGIKNPSDLAGKKAIMFTPGTRNFNVRAEILRAWGLRDPAEQLEIVELSGASDAWVQALLSGQVAATTAFQRHIAQLRREGATVLPARIVNVPQEVMIARQDFIEQNPNTVANMWMAHLQSMGVYFDFSKMNDVLDLMRENDFEITDDFVEGHASQVEEWSPNGGFRMAEMAAFLQEMKSEDLIPADFKYQDFMDLTGLHQAQQALGIGPWPPNEDVGVMTKYELLG